MTIERALELLPQMRDSEWITVVGQVTAIYTDEAKEAFNMAISALEKQSRIITVTDAEGGLLASISDKDIIEENGVHVIISEE